MMAGWLLGVTIFGISDACDGDTRLPGPGSCPAADDRMVIHPEPDLFRSRKLPVKLAPACRTITSPGTAESSALWRLPPALTVLVRPVGEPGLVLRDVRGGAGAAAVCACAAAGSNEVTRVTAPSAATQRREFGNVSLLCQVGRAAGLRAGSSATGRTRGAPPRQRSTV